MSGIDDILDADQSMQPFMTRQEEMQTRRNLGNISNAARTIDRDERESGIKNRLNGSISINTENNKEKQYMPRFDERMANAVTEKEIDASRKKVAYANKKDSYKANIGDIYRHPSLDRYAEVYRNTVHNQMESSGYDGKGGKRRKQTRTRCKCRKSRCRKCRRYTCRKSRCRKSRRCTCRKSRRYRH